MNEKGRPAGGPSHTTTCVHSTADRGVIATPAGIVLAAADALRTRRDGVWTDQQVACLLALAFDSGRTATALDDTTDLLGTWEEHPDPRKTREQRVAGRLLQMEQSAARIAESMGRPGYVYSGGPVEWETGQPVRQLGLVA